MVSMNIAEDNATLGEYNTCPTIYLNDDQVEALGIAGMPEPGTVFMLQVRAVVTRMVAEAEEADEAKAEGNAPDVSLTLQLTDMEILHGGGKSAATLLYGN